MFPNTAGEKNFRQLEYLPEEEQNQLFSLRQWLVNFEHVCVAYSGGVDSSLVAAIAKEQLGAKAVAITGVSPALSHNLLTEAIQQAAWIGIKHKKCTTHELEDPEYSTNPQNRCFACKKELHLNLKEVAQTFGNSQVIDGVNQDDLADHRPGIEAAKNAGVRSPLAELNINKSAIRTISHALGFPWWDKPAQPCLASRFPYGESISAKRLKKVELAENWLKDNGYNDVRVRSQGLAARIELPSQRINQFVTSMDRKLVINYFLSIGFTSVSLDLEGLVSGKLNRGRELSST